MGQLPEILFVITDKPMLQTDCGGHGGEAEGAEGPVNQAAGPQQDTGKNNFFFFFFQFPRELLILSLLLLHRARQLYRAEILHSVRRAVTAAVLRDTIKGTLNSF